MIASYELTRGLANGSHAKPAVYGDLHGNPRSNARATTNVKRIETVCNIECPGDYVRQATKWGPQTINGVRQYLLSALRDLPRDHATWLASLDALISIHTLYYYDRSELAAALALTKNRTMYAIVHRHPGESGNLNRGELTYVKEKVGKSVMVKQTNKETGERYVHPAVAPWFNGGNFWSPHRDIQSALEAGDKLDSLAWTTNKVCDGTYRLTIVAVPAKAAAMNHVASFDTLDVTCKDNSTARLARDNTVSFMLRKEKKTVTIKPEHHALYEEARIRMIGKSRDSQSYRSHVTFVIMKVKGVAATLTTPIEAVAVRDIAMASFWVDFQEDVSNSKSSSFFDEALMVEHNRILDGKSILQNKKAFDVIISAALISLRAKSTKDAIISGLELVRQTV
jgi:hypothetical protein